MPDWVTSLIVSWLPFVIYLGICWYLARSVRRGLFTRDGRSIADVTLELSSELKRLNDRSSSS